MKKILLIEDRSKRQYDLLSKAQIDISLYYEVVDNKIEEKYIDFMENIKKDLVDLSSYEVIIAHNSIFSGDENRSILSKLKNYCKYSGCSLVLFSGGIDYSYINEDYEELNIVAADLYSANLILFLEEFLQGNKNILILNYGNQWKVNIILNTLERINLFLQRYEDDDIDYDEFRNFTHSNLLESLDLKFYQMNVDGHWIYRTEIVKLKNNILNHVGDMIDE